ncbi:MAG TPA: hypothetical protein VK420_20365 [Longimicrobium sp.]|nr:hypothetical protein [Longimicrobium sp.]
MKTSILSGVVAVLSLMGGTALAQDSTAPQDELTPQKSVYMYNVPYGTSYGSDGQYTESGTYYNGAPVYTKAGTNGQGTWSLYKRASGSWYVDFNSVSEDWDGTVAYTATAQDWPWSVTAWNSNVVSFRTIKVEVYNIAYASMSAGTYSFSGQIYNGAPVYSRTGGGYTWSLYKRANGKWHVDFNTVSEDWDGTIAYSSSAMSWPWNGTWVNNGQVFNTRIVYLYNLPYGSIGSTGAYTFNGQIYNNSPVYSRTGGGYTWSLYKRADGKWHVDFNTVSEDWDGTIAYTTAAASNPWSGTWNGSNFAFRSARATVQGNSYWNIGATGDWAFSGTLYNNAPVYTRTVQGSTWSMYKRTNGNWYMDFNTVSEDWDGTVDYTNQAMSYPWSLDNWNKGETVTEQFDQ